MVKKWEKLTTDQLSYRFLELEMDSDDWSEIKEPVRDPRWKEVYLRANDSLKRAKIRKRGFHFYHWLGPKKSLRLKIDQNDFILMNYKWPGYFSEIFASKIGNSLDLLGQTSEMVHIKVNGNYRGLYHLIQTFDSNFLKYNQRNPGTIYSYDNYTYKVGEFYNPFLWETDRKESSREPLVLMLRCIKSECNDIKNLFDLEEWIDFYNLLEILGADHLDAYHNHRLYYDEIKNKFSPIYWDFGFIKNNTDFFQTYNQISSTLMRNSTFRIRRFKKLYQQLNSIFHPEKMLILLEKILKRLESDYKYDHIMGTNRLFLWQDVTREKVYFKENLRKRHQGLVRNLEKIDVELRSEKDKSALIFNGVNAYRIIGWEGKGHFSNDGQRINITPNHIIMTSTSIDKNLISSTDNLIKHESFNINFNSSILYFEGTLNSLVVENVVSGTKKNLIPVNESFNTSKKVEIIWTEDLN